MVLGDSTVTAAVITELFTKRDRWEPKKQTTRIALRLPRSRVLQTQHVVALAVCHGVCYHFGGLVKQTLSICG